MAQIINRPSSRAGEFGGITGRALAGAIEQALFDISQNKLMDIQGRQQLMGQQQQQQQPQLDMSALQSLLLGPQQQQPQQQLATPQEQVAPAPLQQALQTIEPIEKFKEEGKVKESPKIKAPKKEVKVAEKSPKLSAIQSNKELNPDPIKHAAVEAKQDAKIKKMPKLSERQQLAADKETKPYFDDISKQAKAAKDGNIRLDRMEELVKRGNLSNPAVASALDVLERGIPLFSSHIGIDLHALESIDSQEFRKLSNDFIKNAKEFFGSRVTDQDLKAFLKTVPTLNQSNEGRLRVIQNLRSFNDIALIKKKAMNEIIAENDGERPRNLEELVDERTADQVDAIAKRFRERIDIVDTMRAKDPEREKLAQILGI